MPFLWTYKRLFIAKRSSYIYSSLCEAIQRGNNSFVDRVLFFSLTIFLSTITVYKKERKRSSPPYFPLLFFFSASRPPSVPSLDLFFFFLLTGKVHIYTAKRTHTNTKTSVAR